MNEKIATNDFETFFNLAFENGMDIYEVLRNPKCPLSILESLTYGGSLDSRVTIAENPNCPVDILERLSKDDSWIVRSAVAKNQNCPSALLKKLSGDEEACIRTAVAEHSNCPSELLEKFSKDKNLNVRATVAKYQNLPLDILQKLSEDKDYMVRYAVAQNPNCTLEILEKLSVDGHFEVRCIANENPKLSSRKTVRLINKESTIIGIWKLFNNTYNDTSLFAKEETEFAKRILSDVQELIENQPAAFDLESVLGQIEDLEAYYDNDYFGSNRKPMFLKEEVIEILKSATNATNEWIGG